MAATSLPAYDLALDELRVALSYAGFAIDLTPVIAAPLVLTAPKVATGAAAAPPIATSKETKATEEEDDFDVFGDDDDAEKDDAPTESRADMLARLKKEAEERTVAKEAKQRTLVAIEVKPWDVEQDLMTLFKKITETVTQDGLKWAENCNLADVAFGIKKIQTTFTMGAKKYVIYRPLFCFSCNGGQFSRSVNFELLFNDSKTNVVYMLFIKFSALLMTLLTLSWLWKTKFNHVKLFQ
jgi:translation elongation factor EF-1beta